VEALVSIVIPNHNYGRFVSDAVESALSQSYRPIEVIVVDNGSTDDSLARLEAFGDRIRLIAQPDLGQAGSRNRGILASAGEFVAFLDADDVWNPEKLAAQMQLFSDPRIGLVYCSMSEADADLRPVAGRRAMYRGDVRSLMVGRVGHAVIVGGESTAVIRRSCFAEVGLFDPTLSISAGWDMYRRIVGRYEVDFVEEPLVTYRVHGSNQHLLTDAYYSEMVAIYRRLFDDPLWTEYRGRRRSVFARVAMMRAREMARRGRWVRSIGAVVEAGVRRVTG